MESRRYPTDLSDDEWRCICPHLPGPTGQGRPKLHGLRAILDALFYVLKSGCPWRLQRVAMMLPQVALLRRTRLTVSPIFLHRASQQASACDIDDGWCNITASCCSEPKPTGEETS